MAMTDAQWAAEVADIVAELIAGTITEAQASTRLKSATENWPTRTLSNADLAARVSRFLARLNGLLVMEGPPDDTVGELNTFYFDTASGEFYGPKGAGGWGESSFSLVGPPGPAVELQKTATHVQWRVVGDPDWVNLIALADLKGEDGKEIELRSTATHIQWRVVGAATWIDLLARVDLKGDTGATPVITITTTTGEPGSEVTVTRTGTAEAPVFAISIPRGNTGGTGPTPILSVGTVETAPSGGPAGATFSGTAEEPVLNLILPRGGTGNTGAAAWTPVFATVVDGERRVQQIVDWVGGGGAKPAIGKYVGAAGLVDTAAEATDVRGAGGSGSGDMIAANNLSDLTDKAAARTTLSVHSKVEADGLYRQLLDLLNIADVDGLAAALASKATPADVTAAINALVGAAPGTLDTIYELAAWAQDSGDALAALTTLVAGKASQADLDTLVATVGGKASQGALDALAATVGAISVPTFATKQEVWAGSVANKIVPPSVLNAAMEPQALAIAAGTVSPDCHNGINFDIASINANITLANLANKAGKGGRSGSITGKNDATAGRTVSLGTDWKKIGTTAIPTTANALWKLVYNIDANGVNYSVMVLVA